jgi:hypothetical protein
MKEIKLSQGKVTQVDDDLFEWLNQWKWYYSKRAGNRVSGDVVRNLHGRDHNGINTVQSLRMSNLILPLAKGYVVDHIDRNPLNNQRSNLRKASYSLNSRNSGIRSSNKTGVKHVSWHHGKQRYVVQTTIDGKKKWVGAYKTLAEASVVAKKL